MAHKNEVTLGDHVRDQVTGFAGVATARVEFLNGCVQYAIQPAVGEDGKLPDAVYFDWQRVVIVKRATFAGVAEVVAVAPGGPQRDTPSTSYCG